MSIKNCLSIFLISITVLFGQTYVSGVINGETWTPAGSPYIQDGDLTIYSLLINPGVEVLGNSTNSIEVLGQINALGAFQDSVYFRPAEGSEYWSGINFYNVGLQSTFDYCVLSKSHETTLIFDSGPMLNIRHTTIEHSHTDGVYIGQNASGSVTNSLIRHNAVDGLESRGDLWVSNSIIVHNGAAGLRYFTLGDVINCTIAHNGGFAIDNNVSTGYEDMNVTNSILFYNNDGGEQVDGDYFNIRYCDIQNGYPGGANQSYNPLFEDMVDFQLISISPCIDLGNPDVMYDDYCFGPSQGLERNDMGAYGGPEACSWLDVVYGCTDPDGCNYHPSVTEDDGSCLYVDCNGDCGGTAIVDDCDSCVEGETGFEFNHWLDDCGICYGNNEDMDCNGLCFGPAYIDGCGICDDDPDNDNTICLGCTDPQALNYDPEAIIDDDSCEYMEIFINLPQISGNPGDILDYTIQISIPESAPIISVGMYLDCPNPAVTVQSVSLGDGPDGLGWFMESNVAECPIPIWVAGGMPMSGTQDLVTLSVLLNDVPASEYVPFILLFVQADETFYTINVQNGGITVVVPLYGDASLNNQVTPYDAGLVLQYAVDEIEFDPEQEVNAEVSGDGSITAYDASLILQYGVGIIDVFPVEEIPFSLVATGDFYMQDYNVQAGQTISIPIYLENGGDIFSFEFALEYMAEFLTFTGIQNGENLEAFTLGYNDQSGTVAIVGASAYPDGQEGVFLSVEFVVDENFYASSTDVILSEFQLNENEILYDTAVSTLINVDQSIGDLNMDMDVDILDVVIMVGIILEEITPTEYQLYVGDLNHDGDIDILDVVQMVYEILND